MTLDELSQEFAAWRLNKLTRYERIPKSLWEKVRNLQTEYSPNKLCSTLGISWAQLKRQPVSIPPKNGNQQESQDFIETRFPLNGAGICEITIQGSTRSVLIKIPQTALVALLPQLEPYL